MIIIKNVKLPKYRYRLLKDIENSINRAYFNASFGFGFLEGVNEIILHTSIFT